jgi:hypothetical protein
MCLHDFNWITDPFLEGLFSLSLTLRKTSPKDYPVAIHKVQKVSVSGSQISEGFIVLGKVETRKYEGFLKPKTIKVLGTIKLKEPRTKNDVDWRKLAKKTKAERPKPPSI